MAPLPALINSPSTVSGDSLAAEWSERIAQTWRKSVEAIIEVGTLLIEAKASLPHGQFELMIEEDLPFGPRAAQMLMTVAADPRIANHGSQMPPSWRTLHELTRLDDQTFAARLADGTIRPDMERREVIKGARALMSSRQEPEDSLDYFPTPPWATRALIEKVLPRVNLRLLGCVREPACGEGHMAEVLRESATVIGTDVHDYGYGDGVLDFLKAGAECAADWIITNPPFGDKAETCVLKAIDLANIGVAMFFRLQWLETVGRYERIFQPHPPAIIAQFAERVPLHAGRWEPDGDTATAYLWIVWLKGNRSRTEFCWIAPGCREQLSRPDDRERFTAKPVIKIARIATASAAAASIIDPCEIPPFLTRGHPDCAVKHQRAT